MIQSDAVTLARQIRTKEISPVELVDAYTSPFNLSGHPALSLPCGWSTDGLPIGLQIVGPWHADRRVLALAAHLERERPCARAMPL